MRKTIILSAIVIGIYLNNASWIRDVPKGELELLAHRGVHQTYSSLNLTRDECTATRIDPPQHEFLENTIESIARSFDYGANIVEIDIHPTTDGRFAVFHDWTLDCRTEGKGVTRKHSLEYLQTLDIGYGYTSDGGKSHPFRGKGTGKLPSLTEVLDNFPQQRFLINIKSNSIGEADLVVEFLKNRVSEDLSRLWFYGGNKPTSRLLAITPELKGFTKASVKRCAIQYELIGWTGYVPKVCRNTIIAMPMSYAPYFWGWPIAFSNRMASVNTDIILVDINEGHMDGFDNRETIFALSKDYRGVVWTEKIEQVGSIKHSTK